MFEVVFDYNGKIILNDEELGTFNFYSPNKINTHTLYDVIPYWLWGNTENDNSKISDRIIALNNINSLITPIHTPKNLKIRLIVLLKFLRGEAFKNENKEKIFNYNWNYYLFINILGYFI